MFFNKKSRIKCSNCNSDVEKKFSFCPYCGSSLEDKEREAKDFGLLGKEDSVEVSQPQGGFGITDRMINSIMQSLIRNLDRQMREADKSSRISNNFDNTEIQQFPNGIKIKIGMPSQNQQTQKPQKTQKPKQITEEQISRMSSLPRVPAKTSIKRLGNKLVYELAVTGIQSPEDVLISKLESGYEIKAIGKKKVYVNSIPVTLPIKGFSFSEKKLLIEFNEK